MESSAVASYSPQKANSSFAPEPDEVIEIAPPPLSDRTSKIKAKDKGKQKEVAYHEIIDVDMDEDNNGVVLLGEKFESRKRTTESMGISSGASSSTKVYSKNYASSKKGKEILGHTPMGFNAGSNNFFDLDDYVFDDDYSTWKFPFDSIGLPTEVDAPVPLMKKHKLEIPFVTSKAQLQASVSQPKSSLSSSKKKFASVNGPSSKDLGLSSAESSSSIAKLVDGDVQNKYASFKKFDTVVDYSDHHYAKQNLEMGQPPKNWAKKIQGEWRILEKDLPDTIFVRVYESRMDLLRAVIIGAEGTPYHDGLFFFDVYFPSSYPNVPPRVHYRSGGLHINPNLYRSGKVCLSLLNTWSGGKNEMWIPNKSTMLQVLVSIQGLILNMEPYYNEPGRASRSVHRRPASLKYNEDILILSLKTMVYTMKNPPKNFENLVIAHFQYRVRDILMACKAYAEGVQVGCLVKGGVQDVDERGKTCSPIFRHNVGLYIKTLISEFKKIGAKEAEEFRSLSVELSSLPAPSTPARGYPSFPFNQHW